MRVTIKRERFAELQDQLKEATQQKVEQVSRDLVLQILNLQFTPLRDGQNEINEMLEGVEAWLEANEGL
jgi:hypothetical protein